MGINESEIKTCSEEHRPQDLFTEVATFCAKLAPNSQKGAENNKHVEKETPRASKFIADSSPAANKAGMRRECDAKQHGGIVHMRRKPPRSIAWG
jgi:hypothetical protein